MNKAVIFDLDGTLIDTRDMIYTVFGNLAKEMGDQHAYSRKEVLKQAYGSIPDMLKRLLGSDIDMSRVLIRLQELLKQSKHLYWAYDGADSLLKDLIKNGYKLAVVTAGNKDTAKHLDEVGLGHLFDVIITADDVTITKPHPEGVILALEKLNASAEQTVMVGDSKDDILAAKAAGLKQSIGITHGIGQLEDIQKAKPDKIINNLMELHKLLVP